MKLNSKKSNFNIFLAHDHMRNKDDILRDIKSGVSGKILHLELDGWIDAPSKEIYKKTYNSSHGFYERYLKSLSKLELLLKEKKDSIVLIRGKSDFNNAKNNNKFSLILGNEGGKIVGENLENLEILYKRGLRHIQLNWAMKNFLSASQEEEGKYSDTGLSEIGKKLILEMNTKGMIIDVSHSSPISIKNVLKITKKPIINSHSGSRVLSNKPQNLYDSQIKDLADNNGLLALHFCSRLVLGVNDKQSNIPDIIKHVEYIRNLAGIDILALGPDWILGDESRDKNYLINTNQQNITWTKDLEDSSKINNIIDPLEKAGFKSIEIEKLLGENFTRFINDVM